MSLAFLAKKSWHTSNLKNVEQVWIAEQKEQQEYQKLIELQKQIADERQIQELRQLQVDNGHVVKSVDTSLDWMYEGPSASSNQQKTTEEYLLGKIYKPNNEDQTDLHKLGNQAGALWLNKVNSKNDTFTRLHEDPLLLIRQNEKKCRESIINNPLKLSRIQEEIKLQLDKEKTENKVKKDKKDKKEKKEKKENKKEKKAYKKEHKNSNDSKHQNVDDHENKKMKYSNTSEDDDVKYPIEQSHSKDEDNIKKYGLLRRSSYDEGNKKRGSHDGYLGPNQDLIMKKEQNRLDEQKYKFKRPASIRDLSEEEKERRRLSMLSDAAVYDEQRINKKVISTQLTSKENGVDDTRKSGSFLREMRATVYQSDAASIEDNLNKNKHYIQKGKDLDNADFLNKRNQHD